jgi:uncharacterized protein YggT (Ycf19 family)
MYLILQNIIQVFSLFIWFALNFYLILLELRLLTQWFLNFNPYFEPFITMWELTNPMFQFGRKLYPKVFGFELGYLVNFKLLCLLVSFFESVAFADV